ncbi:MAG: GH13_9 / GH13_8 / GH13 / GH13_10 / CBM 48 / GH13_36 [uncultured Friedmanniella sp.]|uniref:1,4-alpha-glucan branching enzyme GlgB n=1 Tax=uncultured Friedmanniella sp. TaxID=335381 RepID=A0A6J4L7L3_9ACTN|nr:1,4-alpha-glucan branching protein GlgB [uncultured Friedmanniella sp.]CAA9324468.1 MAG: GH13_9 / GH13_8 / GH13 / GH13_10 / CBM 48 / GH13_36 [uncultured Friedmanniella sp.]
MAFDLSGGLTGWDLTGFHQGHDTECWRRLGAIETTVHDSERGELRGTRFSVWAPNAQAVRLVGDFNYWNGDAGQMHLVPGSGVWALFVEGAGTGSLYKFEVLGVDGVWRLKADPMARFCEAAPHTASIVYNSQYTWGDDQWLWYRGQKTQHQEPVSIYEVHLGSWRRGLTYLELADQLVEYVSWQGYTHVELMPVAEHPYEGSWGYHVTGYFAPVSRFGTPDEFRHLVDRLHQAGIGVIVDWVPGHFATDPWALQRFDGTALYEHEDPKLGWHPDWGSYIFNFGRNEVQSFLISNAYYWLEEFHIDGLRIDAVASMLYLDYSRNEGQWIPNRYGGNENLEAVELLQRVNQHNYARKPGVMMIAEESTSWPGVTRAVDAGGLGFGFKWNMGWMNDSLRYLGHEPVYRQYHHHEMTFAMAYAYSENYILPISHDEVVHGKGSMFERAPEDEWRKFGNLRAFYSFMWSHPGKQLLFMGLEFAQRREFSEQRSLDWEQSADWGHRGVQRLIKDMNAIYRSTPALHKLDTDPAGFSWISADDHGGNVFSFLRYDGEGQMVACISNFAAEPRAEYRIGLPSVGVWEEILNTDAEVYDGSGQFGNLGRVVAGEVPSHGYPASATVALPPLGSVWLRFLPVTEEATEDSAQVEAGVRAAAKQVAPSRSRAKAKPRAAAEAGSADASVAPKRTRRRAADAKPSQPAATAGTASAARPDAKNKAAVPAPTSAAETPVSSEDGGPAAPAAPAPRKASRRRTAG